MRELKSYTSMWPNGLCLRMLIELARVTVSSLPIIFETSWISELPDDWRKAYVALFKKGQNTVQGATKLASFLFVPGKMRVWVFLEHVSGHKKKEVIGNNWHGFIKGKSRMTSLIAFYGKMAEFLDEGRTVDFIYFDFSKAFNLVSNSILVSRFGHYSLSGWRTK